MNGARTTSSPCSKVGEALKWLPLAIIASACVALACRKNAEPAPLGGESPEAAVTPKPAEVLVFPDTLRVADASVNDFVTTAMSACAKGDYEAFRLLWSARETPLPRDEFEQGWNAARKIEVRALQKGILEPDPAAGRETAEAVYALMAEVSLDPTLKAGKKEPKREVVLMLTREHNQWRIAKAPKPMRDWIKSNLATTAPSAASPVRTEP